MIARWVGQALCYYNRELISLREPAQLHLVKMKVARQSALVDGMTIFQMKALVNGLELKRLNFFQKRLTED